MEVHSIEAVLACGDFKIAGVSPGEGLAQSFALQAILEKAVAHGILQLGCDLHVLGKCWLESGFPHDQILWLVGRCLFLLVKEMNISPLIFPSRP